MNHPRILGIGTANPLVRLTQEESFHAAGYQDERIRKIFLNSDIDHRHFHLEGPLNRRESSDQLNQRYLRGAMKTDTALGFRVEGVVVKPLSDASLCFQTCVIMRKDDDSRLTNEFVRSFLRRYADQRRPPKPIGSPVSARAVAMKKANPPTRS